MQTVTIDWDSVELLPKWHCCVCAQSAVPWGRTQDNEFLCSKVCYEAFSESAAVVASAARIPQAGTPVQFCNTYRGIGLRRTRGTAGVGDSTHRFLHNRSLVSRQSH